MMSVERPEGQMSSHFGKAKWFMVAETAEGATQFVPNEGLNGRSAAEIAIDKGCTDIILIDIGDGALRRLQGANIRIWASPGVVTGNEALRMFAEGRLSLVPAAHAGTPQGGHHGGCCCGHTGSRATGCCQG